MEFKQSTSIMFSNFSLVFKLLLYVLIVTLIFVSLVSAIVIPVFRQITAAESMGYLVDNTRDHVQTFLQGNSSIMSTYEVLKVDIIAIWETFFSAGGAIAAVCIGVFILYILYKFLLSLSFMPTSDILNNFMSSNLRYGFLSNFTLNIRRSVKFSLLSVLIFLPIDAAIIVTVGSLFIGAWQIIKVFALPIALVVGIFLCSFRQSLFAGWIPRLLFHPEEKIFEALKKSYIETKYYRKTLIAAFAIVYFIYWALTGALTASTFGLMLLIIRPMNFVMTRIVELVGYYKINRMRFYTDANTVVDTVAVGLREENQEKINQ
ncbi:MAG: hypothetical protein PHE93_04750 [Clostridia bacterium]|nr:hypothetical protein [Clostridia bacterium]